MYELPTSVFIKDQEFKIRNNGDFRVILDCFDAYNDISLSDKERAIAALIIFYGEVDDIADLHKLPDLDEAIKQMDLFFNCGQEKVGLQTHYKLIDWNQDSSLISSAINNVAKTEIRSVEYCHWWTFMGYYLAIGECPLSNIVNIRYKIATGKPLEKYERKFKQENPEYFTTDYRTNDTKELEQWFLEEVWNK